MARNKQKVTVTFDSEESPITLPKPKVSLDQWNSLGESLMIQVDNQLGNRSSLDAALDAWNRAYEMRGQSEENDIPYPGAPNVITPFIPIYVDEFASRIAGTALLPRPFTVRGNDPGSAQNAHTVEQFYNSQWIKNNWEDPVRTAIHLAGRDGTAILATTWLTDTYERVVELEIPSLENPSETEKQKQRMTQTRFDGVNWEVIELRDFMLFPADAISIEAADGVAWKRYLPEKTLQAMVNAGTLNAEMVERALSFVNPAQGDRDQDRQGVSPYEINNLINVADVSSTSPNGIKMTRGPIRVWQIHSDQYDLDGDGIAEENIFWVHDESRLLLGYKAYEYLTKDRPFHAYAPMPRPNRFYGFSIPERISGLAAEAELQHNGRLEILDDIINRTLIYKKGSIDLTEEDQKLGKNSMIGIRGEVPINQAVGLLPTAPVPETSLEEERLLDSYAQRSLGAPQAPGAPNAQQQQPGGRQSARAAQQNSAINGLQTNMMISRTRKWIAKALQFTHVLQKQYGKGQEQVVMESQNGSNTVTIPKEVLGLDYTLACAGSGGPLDKEAHRQDMQVMIQTLTGNPMFQGLFAGHADRVWAMAAEFMQTFDITDVTRFLGTMDEAMQAQQAQQQAQQQQQKMAQQHELMLAAVNHGKAHELSGQNSPSPSE